MATHLRPLILLLALFVASPALADPARFDLAGPKVDVRVTRSGKTLPIASVPNLAVGDKLWLRPDLPPTQSVRYLMVVAFLRDTTNPPPDDWFIRIETWQKKIREEGTEVTIPADAQQVIVFLAPVTGGDFSTLRSAVRGRPGVFVRASQDLNEAGFEQSRIEKYLATLRQVPPGDAKALQDHSNLLARTLALRPNADCFKRDVDQQLGCLTQTGTQTLLDDGHGQTVASALTTGASADFITAASYTGAAGAGTYSAYVGAVVDLGRLLSGLHTAQYQYIPAIAFPQDESLNLRLNTPPSFNNPKSVIVIGLPAIQATTPPPLRAAEAAHVTCLLQPKVAIPIDGAPLVFSTALAHDLVLHLSTAPVGMQQDLPLVADAYQGGLVLAQADPRHPLAGDPKAPASPADTTGPLTGTIKGFWGFDAFEGPKVPLQNIPGEGWKIVSGEPVIAGHQDHLVLTSSGSACVDKLALNAPTGSPAEAKWKTPDHADSTPNAIDVTLPTVPATPGSLSLAIRQYGSSDALSLPIRTYSEPAKVDTLTLHAGDRAAQITGQHLDQVHQLQINDLSYTPLPGTSASPLSLTLPEHAPVPAFRSGDKLTAHVSLVDGRILDIPVSIAPPRPSITLRGKSTPRDPNAPIKLSGDDVLRVDQPITMILKSDASIPRTEEIEVATQDGSLSSRLNFSSGALVLQDSHTLRVTLDPLKALGNSIFGPVRFRALQPNTDPGDWLPLATLVRVPTVTLLTCPSDQAKPCVLTGSSLFLIDAVSADQAFADPTTVPEDFFDTNLTVPHPTASGILYLRPRDDHNAVATLTLPIQPEPTSTRPLSPKGQSVGSTKPSQTPSRRKAAI